MKKLVAKPKPFAQVLNDTRRRAKLTQEQLATRLGINLRTLQNWSIARRRPNSSLETRLRAECDAIRHA